MMMVYDVMHTDHAVCNHLPQTTTTTQVEQQPPTVRQLCPFSSPTPSPGPTPTFPQNTMYTAFLCLPQSTPPSTHPPPAHSPSTHPPPTHSSSPQSLGSPTPVSPCLVRIPIRLLGGMHQQPLYPLEFLFVFWAECTNKRPTGCSSGVCNNLRHMRHRGPACRRCKCVGPPGGVVGAALGAWRGYQCGRRLDAPNQCT